MTTAGATALSVRAERDDSLDKHVVETRPFESSRAHLGEAWVADAAHSGFHHVTLNVHDVERSERWYEQNLGFVRIAAYETPEFRRVILRHAESGAVLALNRHAAGVAAEPFDERRAGLDHLALVVNGRAALEAWVSLFAERNIPHSEIKPGGVPGSALVTFRDPDGTQLEVFSPAG